MNTNFKWHLVYTRPGVETRVAFLLEQRGFETYLPIFTASVVAGSEKTFAPRLLFSSWVFVCCKETELPSLRRAKGVINVVYRGSKPVEISEAEVETIQFVLGNFSRVDLTHVGLQPREKTLPLPENKLAYPLPSLGYCLLAGERNPAKSFVPSVRTIPIASVKRLALVKESFAYLLNHFPFLIAPKKQAGQTETLR